MEALKRMPFEKSDFIFEKLGKIAEVRRLSKEEQFQYDMSLKAYRDAINVMETAQMKGVEKGYKEGHEKGLAEGRAEGKAEGRVDALIATAKKMKAMGFSSDVIAQATRLSLDEIGEIE